MTWLASELRERIEIKTGEQTEQDDGSFSLSFTTLATLWAGIKPVSEGEYIRGQQIGKNITHEFKVRRSSVESLGTEFSSAFSSGYDTISDLMPLKSDYFIFLQRGSSSKGRLFRIRQIVDHNERRELLRIRAEEIEEKGTGYQS